MKIPPKDAPKDAPQAKFINGNFPKRCSPNMTVRTSSCPAHPSNDSSNTLKPTLIALSFSLTEAALLLIRVCLECVVYSLQILDFLKAAKGSEQYQAAFPSLQRLVKEYNISPHLALTIHRPLLSKMHPSVLPNSEDGEIAHKQAESQNLAAPEGEFKLITILPKVALLVGCSILQYSLICISPHIQH